MAPASVTPTGNGSVMPTAPASVTPGYRRSTRQQHRCQYQATASAATQLEERNRLLLKPTNHAIVNRGNLISFPTPEARRSLDELPAFAYNSARFEKPRNDSRSGSPRNRSGLQLQRSCLTRTGHHSSFVGTREGRARRRTAGTQTTQRVARVSG